MSAPHTHFDCSLIFRVGTKHLQRSIRQIGELLRQGSLSPVELTRDCLARIEKLNPRLNAFITVTADSAAGYYYTATISPGSITVTIYNTHQG